MTTVIVFRTFFVMRFDFGRFGTNWRVRQATCAPQARLQEWPGMVGAPYAVDEPMRCEPPTDSVLRAVVVCVKASGAQRGAGRTSFWATRQGSSAS